VKALSVVVLAQDPILVGGAAGVRQQQLAEQRQ